MRILLCLPLLALLGCEAMKNPSFSPLPDEQGRYVPKGAQINTAVLPTFTRSLAARTGMMLIEGLPNENNDPKVYRAEKKANQTEKRAGYLFYPPRLQPSPADAQAIANALSLPGGIAEFSGGMKQCGGFHPDFAVLWNDASGAEYEAQLCFGCEEIKLFGPAGEKLYADMGPDTVKGLTDVLRHYGKFAVAP